ncbi:hypothetical protein [uncultured Roseibium sp.]|uniref:hypothetical protein n=1 Tax=uncultured Roseibium sp. TaxID=1936171 RepID=UPI003217DDC0
MDIEEAVKKSLGPQNLSDFCETGYGWVSRVKESFMLGPRYLVSYNYPTQVDEIEYILQFSRDANRDLLRDFYRSTNGMRILSDHFVVPGVRFWTPELHGLDFFNIPLDIQVMSGFEYPRHAPVSGAVIGSSFRTIDGTTLHLKDILADDGRIVCGFFQEDASVLETFPDFQTWIAKRIDGAKAEYAALLRSKMI